MENKNNQQIKSQSLSKQIIQSISHQDIQFEYKKILNKKNNLKQSRLQKKNVKNLEQVLFEQTNLNTLKNIKNIKSQRLLRSAKALKKLIQKLGECTICSEQKQQSHFSSLSDCEHKYCKQCVIQYLINKINNYQIIQCPQCSKPVNKQSNAFKNLTIHQKNKYHKIEVIQSIKSDNQKKLCPTNNCLGVLNIKDIPMVCQNCNFRFCKCFMKLHQGQCNLYLRDQLIKNFGFKQCPNCKTIFEKNKGCEHITCKCGHQFCFICLRKWKQGHICNQLDELEFHQNIRLEQSRNQILNPTQLRPLTTNLSKLFLFNFTLVILYILAGIFLIGLYLLILIFPIPFLYGFARGFQILIGLIRNNQLQIYKKTLYLIGIFLFFPIFYLYVVGQYYVVEVKLFVKNSTQYVRSKIGIKIIQGLESALGMRI